MAGVDAVVLAQPFLDAQQLVVFGDAPERAGAPALIWPELVATARSAMVVSSESRREAGEVIVRKPLRCASSTASRANRSGSPDELKARSGGTQPRCPSSAGGVGDEQVVDADQLDAATDLG